MKVVSSSPSFGRYADDPVLLLRDAGCEVVLVDDPTTLAAELADADAWIVGFEPVGAPTLTDAPRVRVAAKCGAGMDNFDHDWLAARGITAVNVPGGNAGAVAEYTMGLLLAVCRRIADTDRAVRAGTWKPVVGTGLDGRTLGVVGFGRIGQRVAALATAFGMRVLASDPVLDDATVRAAGAEPRSLDDLFAEADAVTLHVPLADDTRGLVDVRRLALLRPSAVLVNCSRGGVVDEDALDDALRRGALAGAAVDVAAVEPLPADSPLRSAPNLLLTSHTAGYSDTALAAVTLECARRVLAVLTGVPA